MSQFIPDIRQGDTYPITVEYPYGTNIVGYKFWFTLKRRFSDLDSAAVLQVSEVATGADAEIGLAIISVPPSITNEVPAGEYYWDIQVKAVSGDVKTLLPPKEQFDDRIKVVPQVTQATS